VGASEKGYLYFDIPKQQRDSAIAYLLDVLLKSRATCNMESNKDDLFDEDVNIYLAHLLFAASLPDYQEAVSRYVSKNVSEMNDLVDKNNDRIVRYFIYKVNADHLMVHMGVFQGLENARNPYAKSPEQFSSLARDYYQNAAQHNRRIYRRRTAIGSVLEKLSHHFDRYLMILQIARKDFFHFSNRFNDKEFSKFCRDFGHYEQEEKVNDVRDRFLDAYAKWLETKDADLRLRLIDKAKKLKEVDPDFEFDQM